MSGEEELTSSEDSSLLWECCVDFQTDPTDLLYQSPCSREETLQDLNTPQGLSTAPGTLAGRSHHQVRAGYFQKLRKIGMLPEKPRKKSHHTIVFDWDDTLFCTSYMSSLLQGDWTSAGDLEKQKMADIDQVAQQTLLSALDMAEVTIVTNSAEGWVDFCCETFMPSTHATLLDRRIEIISARERYEREYPGDPLKWKTEAFTSVLSEVDSETVLNVMSIGDSSYEMEAADASTSRFCRRFLKTLRLRQKPRGDQLLKQLKLVNSRLKEVFGCPKNLSIKLQPKQ